MFKRHPCQLTYLIGDILPLFMTNAETQENDASSVNNEHLSLDNTNWRLIGERLSRIQAVCPSGYWGLLLRYIHCLNVFFVCFWLNNQCGYPLQIVNNAIRYNIMFISLSIWCEQAYFINFIMLTLKYFVQIFLQILNLKL